MTGAVQNRAALGVHWHLHQEPVAGVSATSAGEWFYFNSRGCQSSFLMMKWRTRACRRWRGHKYFIAVLCMCKWLMYLFSSLWNGRQWVIPSAPESVSFVLPALGRMGRLCPWTCLCQFEIELNCDLQVFLLSLSGVTVFKCPGGSACVLEPWIMNEKHVWDLRRSNPAFALVAVLSRNPGNPGSHLCSFH